MPAPWRAVRPPGRRHGVGLAVATAFLAGCAALAPRSSPEGLIAETRTWAHPTGPVTAHWLQPSGPPAASARVLLLQHGFTRQCRHLAGLRASLARAGWAVVCLDLAHAAGDDALPAELVEALIEGPLQPPGGVRPQARWVVGGFSAGAVLAARTGAAFHARAPARLHGLLLLDPVDARGFGAAIEQVSHGGGRAVLALLANPGPCNAQGSAVTPLRRLAAQVAPASGATEVVLFVRGSTHVDAEGEDTGDLAVAVCRQGPPQARNVATLREIAGAWLAALDDPRRLSEWQALVADRERSGDLRRLGPEATR